MKLQGLGQSHVAVVFATFLLFATSSTLVSAAFEQQRPLASVETGGVLDVRHELKRAEIIPTVIDDFLPVLTFSAKWSNKVNTSLGNTEKPKKLQRQPTISLYGEVNESDSCTAELTYIVTLTDPDAPSRDNPEWSEMCHWIASGVSVSQSSDGRCVMTLANLNDIIPYKPPGPPKKTGKHRYVFLVFTPTNGTSEPLDLTRPKDRQHWGTGKERHGVRDWAAENELTPVAANFLYSQHKEQ